MGLVFKRGFTLCEVLIATAITGVIVVSLVGLFLLTGVSGNFGLNRARATQLAQAEVTRLKLLSYQSLATLAGTASAPITENEEGTDFIRSTRVDRLSNVPGNQDYWVMVATVEVQWKERRNLDMSENKIKAGEAQGSLNLTSVLTPEAQY